MTKLPHKPHTRFLWLKLTTGGKLFCYFLRNKIFQFRSLLTKLNRFNHRSSQHINPSMQLNEFHQFNFSNSRFLLFSRSLCEAESKFKFLVCSFFRRRRSLLYARASILCLNNKNIFLWWLGFATGIVKRREKVAKGDVYVQPFTFFPSAVKVIVKNGIIECNETSLLQSWSRSGTSRQAAFSIASS